MLRIQAGQPRRVPVQLFCELYQRWRKGFDISLWQEHLVGEKALIDYAGQTVPIFNPDTGNVDFEAQIFIVALRASNYSYAKAVLLGLLTLMSRST